MIYVLAKKRDAQIRDKNRSALRIAFPESNKQVHFVSILLLIQLLRFICVVLTVLSFYRVKITRKSLASVIIFPKKVLYLVHGKCYKKLLWSTFLY